MGTTDQVPATTRTDLLPDLGVQDLSDAHFNILAQRWITPNIARKARLSSADSIIGASLIGRTKAAYAGLVIPYFMPGRDQPVEYQLRLDHPPMEPDSSGKLKPRMKYAWPPGRRARPYFEPGLDPALLLDPDIPIIVTEGPLKVLALHRLSVHVRGDGERPPFIVIGFIGVFSWRCTTGKTVTENGDRVDVTGPLPEFDLMAWEGRKVIVAYDADVSDKPQVRAARWQFAKEAQRRNAIVGFLEWPIEKGKGIDDLLANVGPEEALDLVSKVDFDRRGWHATLIRTETGAPRAVLANALAALRNAPEWKGLLSFCEFSLGIYAQKPAPWGEVKGEWTDHEDRLTTEWLQHHGIHVNVEIAGQAAQTVARENSFHPVRNYLSALKWDGIHRLDNWLLTYAGVEAPSSNDDGDRQYEAFIRYTGAIGSKWMISAVARIFKPGCKADSCLIMEGAQGIGKSTAFRILGVDWFSDELSEIGSKDASLQTRGAWLIELSELDAMSRADSGKIKAFMSRATDRFRPPYGKRLITSPRQCVFAGSCNLATYLKDESGGRRFWPVKCVERIRLDELARDRDQLWAEAVHRFRSGESWWLDSSALIETATEEQAERFDSDPWQPSIEAWLKDGIRSRGRDYTTSEEILDSVIQKKRADWTQADKGRVARCLKALHYERFKGGPRNAREWRYGPRRMVSQS